MYFRVGLLCCGWRSGPSSLTSAISSSREPLRRIANHDRPHHLNVQSALWRNPSPRATPPELVLEHLFQVLLLFLSYQVVAYNLYEALRSASAQLRALGGCLRFATNVKHLRHMSARSPPAERSQEDLCCFHLTLLRGPWAWKLIWQLLQNYP